MSTITKHTTKAYEQHIDATVARNILTAEVLDYDGYESNYAIIYKEIQIDSAQTHTEDKTASYSTDDAYFNTGGDGVLDYLMPYVTTTIFESSTTRTVNFYLAYNAGGGLTKNLIATCTITSLYNKNGTSLVESHVVTGERVCATSIQVDGKTITYTYEVAGRDPALPTINYGREYDGAYAFENWDTDIDENMIWKADRRVVGIIAIDDPPLEPGTLHEASYAIGAEDVLLSDGEVYSVGTYMEES